MLFNNTCICRRRVCRINRSHDTDLIDKLYSFLVKKCTVKMDYCNYFDNLFLSFENDTDVLQNDTDVLVTSRLQIVYFRIDALGFFVAKLHHF